MRRILVLGSGTGGTLTANILANELRERIRNDEVSLILLGEGSDHVFQPANLDVAFKGARPEGGIRDEKSLLDREVKFIPEASIKIDLANRKVALRRGGTLSYDYLVLATGSVASPELIPGLAEGSLNFHTGPHNAVKIWEALQRFRKGKALVLISSIPHKCPPSPNEAAFMLDEYFTKKHVRGDVEIKFLTPYPRAYPSEPVSKVIQPLFEERGIGLIPFFNTDSVDPEMKTVTSLEGEKFDYDLLIAVPPHQGGEVVRNSFIGGRDGWIPTDKKTMVVKDYSEVYALGDATNIPISKSGVVAHLQSGIVAENLLSELDGTGEKLEYGGRINCPMETGNRRATFVSATYTSPPKGQTPSLLKYMMKKSFGTIYWSALKGRWDWLFNFYFGQTSFPAEPSNVDTAPQLTVPA